MVLHLVMHIIVIERRNDMLSSLHTIPVACGIAMVISLTMVGCIKKAEDPLHPPGSPYAYGTNYKIKAARFDACMKLVPTSRNTLSHVSTTSVNAPNIPVEQTATVIQQCNEVSLADAVCTTSSEDKDCVPNGYY